MHDSNTRMPIFDFPYLIYHWTKTVTPDPGSVIKVEVQGLGTLENLCVGEE